eukprot:1180284-Prorocentrum_minimum.AAC.2
MHDQYGEIRYTYGEIRYTYGEIYYKYDEIRYKKKKTPVKLLHTGMAGGARPTHAVGIGRTHEEEAENISSLRVDRFRKRELTASVNIWGES